MKILKYLLIGIICLVVVICPLGLILPKEYTVARSTVIKAPRQIVLEHVKNLKTMDKWSPWSKKDPNIKQEFGGNDGEVGSWSKWEGNKDVGKGKQEVTAVTDNSVDFKLTFLEPWQTVSDVKFNDIGPFFMKNLPMLIEATGKAGLQPAGAPSGIYFNWEPEKQQTDMAAAIPFAAGPAIPIIKGTEQVKASGKALQIIYYGAYEKVGAAHDAMDDYMKEKNLTLNELVIEEYINGPKTEKDTAKWQTNIYYLVK